MRSLLAWRLVSVLCASACAAAAIAAPSASLAAPLAPCATTVAPSDLTRGQQAIGYTVRSGEIVEPFNVEILGVQKDGISPGTDLIVVDTSGPVIDEGGGGISAGMSGSPVYTQDGKLIGAIAYGFSGGPSSVGGVTPATEMLKILDYGPGLSARRSSSSVRLSSTSRARVARESGAGASATDDQLHEIATPLSLSVGFRRHRSMIARAFAARGMPALATSGASASSLNPSASLDPGDSLAAALSYGDATAGAIGTTTYVCNGQALGFGHPFSFDGRTLLGASRADVLRVVDDPAYGPFKLAQITDPVGTIDQDRGTGIRSALGSPIPTIPITQRTSDTDTGAVRNGETDAVDSTAAGAVAAFPEIALGHFFNNSDATLDRIGAGSAQISWSITGILRRSGQSWALTRSNRWTSSADITADAATELVDALFSLSEQNLEPIRFTGVHIDVSIEQAVHQYRIDKALWSKDGVHFANVRRLRVRPKHWIYARVLLADSNDGSSRTVNFRFLAPHRQLVGTIDISNAQDSAGSGSLGDCLFFDECSSSPGSDASNFQALLTGLADQPRNDDLLASSSFGPAEHKRSRRLDRVVTGSDSLEVLVGSASGGGGGPPSGFSFRAGHQ